MVRVVVCNVVHAVRFVVHECGGASLWCVLCCMSVVVLFCGACCGGCVWWCFVVVRVEVRVVVHAVRVVVRV